LLKNKKTAVKRSEVSPFSIISSKDSLQELPVIFNGFKLLYIGDWEW
jgi:hypothetical protein